MTINLNIVVADPSVIIRSGIEATLKRIQGVRFHIDEVSVIDTLYEFLKKRKPDILIINPALLGYASLSLLREECVCPKLKCVALLYAVAERSLLNQYDEFITIYDSAEDIKNKLEKISIHEEEDKTEDDDELQTLSSREKEIVVCVVKGLTNREIAEQLYLSAHTVITIGAISQGNSRFTVRAVLLFTQS